MRRIESHHFLPVKNKYKVLNSIAKKSINTFISTIKKKSYTFAIFHLIEPNNLHNHLQYNKNLIKLI